ncbi:MAG: hypothetical protein IJU79_06525 [Desulfovibrionaceae bacterium]|nr:hypothetical protein [Desulfovibrionaceae bacterium]
MLRIILSCLLLFLCGGLVAQAAEPTTHNYNNSNIYYGESQSPDNIKPDEYGIRTFRDPETGDRMTQIRSRPYPQQQQQQPQMPIYVEPRVRPYY